MRKGIATQIVDQRGWEIVYNRNSCSIRSINSESTVTKTEGTGCDDPGEQKRVLQSWKAALFFPVNS